jgi:hypothetical protein
MDGRRGGVRILLCSSFPNSAKWKAWHKGSLLTHIAATESVSLCRYVSITLPAAS